MILSTTQTHIQAILDAAIWLSEHKVPVLSENLCDIGSTLEKKMAERNICAMIMTPGFSPTSDASKVIVGDASVIVQVLEKPFINRKRAGFVTAQDAAEYIAWRLNMQPLPGNIGVLVLTPPGITSTTRGNDTLIYNCNFKIKTNITNPIED